MLEEKIDFEKSNSNGSNPDNIKMPSSKKAKKDIGIIVFMTILILVLLTAIFIILEKKQVDEEVVNSYGEVNGHIITEEMFNKSLKQKEKDLQKELTPREKDNLLREIMEEIAIRDGYISMKKVTDQEVDEAIAKEAKETNKSEEELYENYYDFKLAIYSKEDFKDQFRSNIATNSYLNPNGKRNYDQETKDIIRNTKFKVNKTFEEGK